MNPERTLRVVAWNVCRGGGPRCAAITAVLTALSADVVVVSEFWPKSSGQLHRRLADAGFVHQRAGGDPSGGYTGLLVASRHPIDDGALTYSSVDDGHRLRHVRVHDWNLVGLYIPHHERGSDRKQRLWRFVVDDVDQRLRAEPTLLIGDLNTGLHYRDELGASFVCDDDLQALHTLGWRDVWTELRPDDRPPASWHSPKYANPFRVDHAILSPSAPRALCVEYPTTLPDGTDIDGSRATSDHRPVIVDLPLWSHSKR